jgi:hypothetical protein
MSDKKLFGLFSGTHIVAAFGISVLAPTTLYAVAFTPVAITDPVSGRQAAVDAGRRLYTYDPIADYANIPANYVQILAICVANTTFTNYVVPAGQALIAKSIQLIYWSGTVNFFNKVEIYSDDINGTRRHLMLVADQNVVGTHTADLGNGVITRSGGTIYCNSTVPVNFILVGYFVPANAVPPAGSGG